MASLKTFVVGLVVGLATLHGLAVRAALVSSTSTRGDGKTVVQFTSGSGQWTVPAGVTSLELLVVGGGGGTNAFSSGGGAGGLFYSSSYSPSGGAVNVTVGNGGQAVATTLANGENSVFDSVIAYGGQGVNGYRPVNDQSGPVIGGSQGGYSTNGGATVTSGNSGGFQASFDGQFDSGGGAGAAGTHGNAAAGGIGLQVSITGTATYYAGGGGSLVNGPGGLGGGGTGGDAPTAGGTNTGGGGGGGWSQGVGAAGGSGFVAVAYVAAVPEPGTVALAACGGACIAAGMVRRRR